MRKRVNYYFKNLETECLCPDIISLESNAYLSEQQLLKRLKNESIQIPSRFQVGVSTFEEFNCIKVLSNVNWSDTIYSIGNIIPAKKPWVFGAKNQYKQLVKIHNGTTYDLTDQDKVLDNSLNQIYPPINNLGYYQKLIFEIKRHQKIK